MALDETEEEEDDSLDALKEKEFDELEEDSFDDVDKL